MLLASMILIRFTEGASSSVVVVDDDAFDDDNASRGHSPRLLEAVLSRCTQYSCIYNEIHRHFSYLHRVDFY